MIMSDEEYESGFFPIWNILTFVLSGSEKLYHIVQRMVRYRNDYKARYVHFEQLRRNIELVKEGIPTLMEFRKNSSKLKERKV